MLKISLKKTLKKVNIVSIILVFGIFIGSCSPKTYKVTKIEGKQIAIDSTLKSNKSVEELVAPYREELEKEMNIVLAYTPLNLTRERKDPETTLGNFIADLSLKWAKPKFDSLTNQNIDFVLLNVGGLRADINKGDVKVRNAFEVMPFENSLVVVQISHDKFIELMEYYGVSENPHPISKNLRMTFKDSKIVKYSLNGIENEKLRSYYVLTNDYLSNGGDHMNFFLKPISTTELNYKVRDALLDELKAIDTIEVKLDGRLERL
jgi:5'-nucleotidase